MRKVSGEEITIKELKNCHFGYFEKVDDDKIVEIIECDNKRFSFTGNGDGVVMYPTTIDSDVFPSYTEINEKEYENLTVWDFINNWWGLDGYGLECFTFYFYE